ncbi:TAXI family TRAP transporter solute-binding subunit [Micromonospora sp. PLK6-60]|nr:TAXI family TRAP transporter solute-binding subunit [Micromonospora sp. PLK6-60]
MGAGLLTTAGAGLLAGCGGEAPRTHRVRIATGGLGGVYAELGAALTRALTDHYPELRAEVLVTSASATNLMLVHAGDAEVGFTQADILSRAGHPALFALARLYDDCLHLVVRAGDGARAVTALRGSRVSPGPAGSGTEITASRVLAAAGLRFGDDLINVPLGLDESARALAAGEISAFFFSGGLPVKAITALAGRLPVRLVSLARYLPALRQRYGEVYAERTIPRSTYEVPSVATIGVPNYLVAHARLPEEVGYALTRTLLGQRDVLAIAHPAAERINHMAAIATDPLPLHPGAARYFRDNKR